MESNYVYDPRDLKYIVCPLQFVTVSCPNGRVRVALVCPFTIWPGQGFYVELFLIDAFPFE